jgi:hypothetical protein
MSCSLGDATRANPCSDDPSAHVKWGKLRGDPDLCLRTWVLLSFSTPDLMFCRMRPMYTKFWWIPTVLNVLGDEGVSLHTRFQIGVFRPIRVDHTNCLQVAIKTHSYYHMGRECGHPLVFCV